MLDIQSVLNMARAKHATDVHIVSGAPVLLRIEGELGDSARYPGRSALSGVPKQGRKATESRVGASS